MRKMLLIMVALAVGMAASAQRYGIAPLVKTNTASAVAEGADMASIPDASVSVGYCSRQWGENDVTIGLQSGDKVNFSAAICLPASLVENKGDRLFAVRFAVGSTLVEDAQVFISEDLSKTPLYTQAVEVGAVGWNYFLLDTPFELSGKDIYVGYSFATSKYAVGVEYATEENSDADWLAVNGEWTHLPSALGAKCVNTIEAMLTGGDYSGYTEEPVHKTVMDVLDMKTHVKEGESHDATCTFTNYGVQTIKSFDLVCQVGVGEEQRQTVTDVRIPNGASYTASLPQQTFEKEGTYQVTVTVSVEGEAYADEQSMEHEVFCYPDFFDRKVLLESYTSQSCTYCPMGHESVEEAIEGYEDRFVQVAHHAGYATDDFTIQEDLTYANFFRITSAPTVTVDRSLVWCNPNNTVGFNPISYFSADFVKDYVETPSFASVELVGTYDNDSRDLTITVSGELLKGLPDARLNVYLTESGYKARQVSTRSWINDYIHDHFMRAVLSGLYGDELDMDGNRYSKTYTYQVPEKIGSIVTTPYNMSVVAFVADYTDDRYKCAVHNAESLDLKDIGAISAIGEVQGAPAVISVEGDRLVVALDAGSVAAAQVELYSLDGKKLKELRGGQGQSLLHVPVGDLKGIYVVKVSDGKGVTVGKVVL